MRLSCTLHLFGVMSDASSDFATSWEFAEVVIGVEQQEEGTGGMEGVAESGCLGKPQDKCLRSSRRHRRALPE